MLGCSANNIATKNCIKMCGPLKEATGTGNWDHITILLKGLDSTSVVNIFKNTTTLFSFRNMFRCLLRLAHNFKSRRVFIFNPELNKQVEHVRILHNITTIIL